MAEPHVVGSLFWYPISYPRTVRAPLVNRTTSTEVDPPFRHGRAVVLRAPFTGTALVIGRWSERLDERTALERALGLRVVEDNGAGFEDSLA